MNKKRINLGKIHQILPKLDFISLQKESYRDFLINGIARSLKEINGEKGIEDYTGKNWVLFFGQHRIGDTPLSYENCRRKKTNYVSPLYVEATLINKKTNDEISQEVFLGDLPVMTPMGTFIINGIERVVVNQLVRSPGVIFEGARDQILGRLLYQAELRPMHGSWLEFMIGRRDLMTIKIDKRRKIPATVLLRAVGYGTDDEILSLFKKEIKLDKYKILQNTLKKDPSKTQNEALLEIYSKMRPGEPAVLDNAKEYFKNMFYDIKRYDLGEVGRYKINRRLKIDVSFEKTVLDKEDILFIMRYLILLQNDLGKVDDIDHLSNRRVRRVGELVQTNAFRLGLTRLEHSIKEKMSLSKNEENLTPAALINARPLIAAVQDFFRRNRLSTIVDQTNPLSEVDNLRRLSVMGTGGVTKERASFSMRDINASQYSRICPVRSPEGPNIGLVTYLSLYAKINKFGFLEAPYLKVQNLNGKMQVIPEIVYLSADDEEERKLTHAGINIDENGFILDKWVPMRYMNNFIEGPVEELQYIDVVPRQVIGTSAALIPFIAHDEANRALMGSHMQCQAVPLLKAQTPVVGTGIEEDIAIAMKRTIKALFNGVVEYVDSQKVIIKVAKKDLAKAQAYYAINKNDLITFDGEKETFYIKKFLRTSQSMCYSQKTHLNVGQKIKVDDLIIDGPASDQGELALGANLLIAYMSFDGLGYEDAIVISDRLVKEDVLTSIQINEYRAKVMDTKLGPEELTNDIPNVSETYLKNLDLDGIIRIGSEVKFGDILVGKVAPRGETELSPEERLLRAIFGEKSKEIKDTSLRLPYGENGVVISVEILDRDLGDDLEPGVNKEVIAKVAQMRKITVGDKLAGRHGNKGIISKIIPSCDMPYLIDGTPLDIIISPLSVLARMNLGQLLESYLGYAATKLNITVAVPAFEKISEDKIVNLAEQANLPINGKFQLYDGRTGKPFMQETVVGIGYIMKLSHMVEDKIHARSTGPYSLVTQQPLGGKAQMGGQRVGEMEVWAFEAHKAAHVLQEMLTIKSDDVTGRTQAFEAIVKGKEIPASTVPESFKVLMRELNSLCLDIKPIDSKEKEEEINFGKESDLSLQKELAERMLDDQIIKEDLKKEIIVKNISEKVV